jgi:hypothetical protein
MLLTAKTYKPTSMVARIAKVEAPPSGVEGNSKIRKEQTRPLEI